MKKQFSLLIALGVATLVVACASQPAPQTEQEQRYVVVKFNSADQISSFQSAENGQLSSEMKELQSVLKAISATKWEPLQKAKFKDEALAAKMGMNRLGRLYFKNDKDATEVIDALRESGLVEYAEQDREAHIYNGKSDNQ